MKIVIIRLFAVYIIQTFIVQDVFTIRFTKKKQFQMLRAFSEGEPLKIFNQWFKDELRDHEMAIKKELANVLKLIDEDKLSSYKGENGTRRSLNDVHQLLQVGKHNKIKTAEKFANVIQELYIQPMDNLAKFLKEQNLTEDENKVFKMLKDRIIDFRNPSIDFTTPKFQKAKLLDIIEVLQGILDIAEYHGWYMEKPHGIEVKILFGQIPYSFWIQVEQSEFPHQIRIVNGPDLEAGYKYMLRDSATFLMNIELSKMITRSVKELKSPTMVQQRFFPNTLESLNEVKTSEKEGVKSCAVGYKKVLNFPSRHEIGVEKDLDNFPNLQRLKDAVDFTLDKTKGILYQNIRELFKDNLKNAFTTFIGRPKNWEYDSNLPNSLNGKFTEIVAMLGNFEDERSNINKFYESIIEALEFKEKIPQGNKGITEKCEAIFDGARKDLKNLMFIKEQKDIADFIVRSVESTLETQPVYREIEGLEDSKSSQTAIFQLTIMLMISEAVPMSKEHIDIAIHNLKIQNFPENPNKYKVALEKISKQSSLSGRTVGLHLMVLDFLDWYIRTGNSNLQEAFAKHFQITEHAGADWARNMAFKIVDQGEKPEWDD